MFFAKKVDLKEEIEAEKGDTPQKDAITRTQSFKPLWHGTLHSRTNVKVHTLSLIHI